MAVEIDNKPITWWSVQELRNALDIIVSTRGCDRNTVIIAEAVARLLAAVPVVDPKPVTEDANGK